MLFWCIIKIQLLQIVVDSIRDSKVGVVFDPKSLIETLAKLIARYTRSHISGRVWMTVYGIYGSVRTWIWFNQPLIICISGLNSLIYPLNRSNDKTCSSDEHYEMSIQEQTHLFIVWPLTCTRSIQRTIFAKFVWFNAPKYFTPSPVKKITIPSYLY